MKKEEIIKLNPILEKVSRLEPVVWINPDRKLDDEAWDTVDFTLEDIQEANDRFIRFAPLMVELFGDIKAVRESNGILESELVHLKKLEEKYRKEKNLRGNLYYKLDSELPVCGSIKARGGLYEVLVYAEQLAMENNLINEDEDYSQFADQRFYKLFNTHTIQVASTGNLGISVGVMGAALGFNTIIHMSNDAKDWKKDLLRSKGATVIEHSGNFSEAIQKARELSNSDPKSYFVDDEDSTILFKGYSTSALRVKKQLEELNIKVDKEHPVFLYMPCGVGGSSGGTAFGFRRVLGDNVHAFFVETTHIPSFLVGASTKLHSKVAVEDLGIDGITEADGLSVSRPSRFSGYTMESLLSGVFTCEDAVLFEHLKNVYNLENIKVEPSSCSSIQGAIDLFNFEDAKKYLEKYDLLDKQDNITHICWATGGNMIPEDVFEEYLNR